MKRFDVMQHVCSQHKNTLFHKNDEGEKNTRYLLLFLISPAASRFHARFMTRKCH